MSHPIKKTTSGFLSAMLMMVSSQLLGQGEVPSNTAVVTLDYAIAETLQALGEPPQAVGGLSGYRVWWRDPQVLSTAMELGSRHLPNLELIQDIAPSHILISPPAHANLIPQLSRLATLKKWVVYETPPALQQRLNNLTTQLAELTGDQAHANDYLRGVEAQFEALAEQRKHSERSAQSVVLVSLMDERHARVYGPGSLEGLVLEQLGINNAWEGDVNRWGFATVTAEQLFGLEDYVIMLESPYSVEGTQQTLLEQGIWQHWPALTSQDTTTLAVDYWHWGGWPSALRFAEALVDILDANEAN
ncbi:ABC transporter substrate-binding protein [Vreelandella venusta]|uniref:ABC transporter substrate-binding protein n=1 Tax=Vreelandella venusta TaxID=44935 RepID=A0AAP9ZFW1_9GAMM|nr:ABC transporter substrate-binding protein [Halomonas venusta]QRL04159.1 ABC transporter substrate-binding protein [Halomonas venusta]